MESQLSSAQDKIGAAERQRRDLALKNQQLNSEVASWQTAFNTQVTSQLNPVASSSTVPQTQSAMQPQMSGPQTLPLQWQTEIRPPPVPTLRSMQREPSFAEQMQRQRRVSFSSVFDATSGPNDGGHNNEDNGNDWDDIPDVGNTSNQQNTALFKLEIKPKDPPMFYGRAAEDVSTWISKVSDFFYLTGATD